MCTSANENRSPWTIAIHGRGHSGVIPPATGSGDKTVVAAAGPVQRNVRRCVASVLMTAILALLTACTVGPRYVRPHVDTPAAYKELAPEPSEASESWKEAVPSDGAIRGKWWEAFHDPALNALEERIDISNQNIAAASATFAAARALVRQAKSQYYPTLAAGASITRSHPSSGQYGALLGPSGRGLTLGTSTDFSLPVQASWEPDLWGRVRQSVRANSTGAQISAADLESVRLNAHAELAIDYYELRGQDALKRLLDDTAAAYREALDLVQTQYQAGLANDEAVASAETQLESAEAQAANAAVLRAQYEHAIALLVGQAPSTVSIEPEDLTARPPEIPPGLPSQLLERRPDIAAAERQVAQENAQIGAAKTAFFPSLLLSATGGFGSTSLSDWLTWPSRFWSLGPSITETVFDAGLRRATVQQQRANYDQAVAAYRQTVLTAFQQVEDNLAAMRVLSDDIEKQTAATQSAERNLRTAMTRYQAGLDPYLNVISAQTFLLGTRQVQVAFQAQQMQTSVQLIEALGGGWDTSQMPAAKQLSAKSVRTSGESRP